MPIIVGLGNIGDEYDGTRHNVGFRIVYKLAETLNISFKKGKGPFLAGTGQFKGNKTILILPTTYMNRSGSAVKAALNWYNEPLENCLICLDDINLPAGEVRLRPNGGDGGHNGLKDIIESVNSKQFPRLRFGIDKNFQRGRQVDYVLAPFSKNEIPIVEEALDTARDALLCFLREGIDRAMNEYN